MSRYIDADEARKNVFSILHGEYPTPEEDAAVGAIDETPTADVAPVVHAHWIKKSHEWDFPPYFYFDFTCSNCGVREQDKAPYCRYCGAKMDEEGDDE